MQKGLQSLATVTREHFEEILAAFVKTNAAHLRNATWIGGQQAQRKLLLEGDTRAFHLMGPHEISSLFVPFVRKKIIGAGERVIIVGDLHGDFETLKALFKLFYEHDYIDATWHVRSDIKIIFLGDYSNRGRASVPVMALLMQFYTLNPSHVILLRGNHEYPLTNKLFHQRFLHKRALEGEHVGEMSLLEELQARFPGYKYPDLLCWYDYLPQAVFLGWDDGIDNKNFIQFCHGGIEFGYSPKTLLETHDSETFEQFEKFERGKQLQELIKNQAAGKALAQRIDGVLAYLTKNPNSGFELLYADDAIIDFNTPQSSYHCRFGLQWNNFLSEQNDEILFAASPKRKNLILGSELTRYFLHQASSENAQLCGIIRAHQHLNETIEDLSLKMTMFDDTRSGKGVVRQWGGLIYTLGASSGISGVQSCIVFSPEQQSIHHYYKRPDAADFSLMVYRFQTRL